MGFKVSRIIVCVKVPQHSMSQNGAQIVNRVTRFSLPINIKQDRRCIKRVIKYIKLFYFYTFKLI